MPRAVSVQQYNTFVKGLVTEANPLTYPENASLDEDNFVLKRNGSRERRLGVDYETGYALTSTGLASSVIAGSRQSFHKWENPGGATDVSIGVIRVYNRLWFVDLLTDNPSANLLNSGNYIEISGLANAEIETAVISNLLVLVSKDLEVPIVLDYDRPLDIIVQSTIPIQVRDLFGVNDGLAIDERPSTLTRLHEYNLVNQGWTNKIQVTCAPVVPPTTTYTEAQIMILYFAPSLGLTRDKLPFFVKKDPAAYVQTNAIECTKSVLGVYPSNADIWTYGKVGDVSDATNFEKYDPNTLIRSSVDNLEASKGRNILDAFNRGESRRSIFGDISLPLDKENGHITTVASYAGRVFYSGVISEVTSPDAKSPNFSNYIFFSQVVTTPDKLGKCYQEADPTSENVSDIVDTDGGVIQIPEISRIVRLVATKSSLLVFAENGIWEIFGDTNGFVATSYQSSKVTTTGCSSPKSVVEAVGTIFAWTKAGIYIITEDQVSGRYKAESISLLTVQSLYTSLSEVAKNNARGFYDEKENTIRWLYNDTSTYSSSNYVTKYNRELVLDLTLQAFYPQSISVSTPYVADYIDIPNYTTTDISEAVYAGTDEVLVGTEAIVVTTTSITNRVTQFSFLTMVGTSFTFSKYNNRSFRDWVTYDSIGVDYSSYMVTGYEVFGEIMRTKQVPYVWFYFLKTEDGYSLDGSGNLQIDNPSSCFVQAQWNWADSANSGQWGSTFQAYKFNRNYTPSGPADTFDNGYEVIVTKNKLRGSGRSLSLKIQSESGKDMKLLGWAVMVAAGATP